jgi:hypothetical protein
MLSSDPIPNINIIDIKKRLNHNANMRQYFRKPEIKTKHKAYLAEYEKSRPKRDRPDQMARYYALNAEKFIKYLFV